MPRTMRAFRVTRLVQHLKFGWFRRRPRRLISSAALIRIDTETWNELFDELGRRGEGVGESGAFLLGTKAVGPGQVTDIVYFDDLDEQALTGAIHLRAYAFSRLWRLCRERGLSVIADIHTHPSSWVKQSSIDRANPMVARVGHIALIAPDFARGSRNPGDIGVHLYEGDRGWRSHFGSEAAELLVVGR